MTEISIGEKEKGTNKGTNKQYVAVFCFAIQLITIKLCTKFQNPNPSSCWEIFDGKKVYRQTDKQTNKITEKPKTIYPLYTSYRGYKEGKMSFSIFIFIYAIHLAHLKLYTKFENTRSKRSREICNRNFHWRERKMNK